MPERVLPVDLADETEAYMRMHADLVNDGYRDVVHGKLRIGQRVRHRGEQFFEALDKGTGVIVAVTEHRGSSWGHSYRRPDIEVIVLRDKPLFEGGSRLSQLADYHIAVVGES